MEIDDKRLPDRFLDKVSPEPNTGCWLWTGSLRGPLGHAAFAIGSRSDGTRRHVYAYRFAYETLVGPVPHGLELDHVNCSTPSCVNPRHLVAVSHRENVLRGRGVSADYARRTHCERGHLLGGANVWVIAGRPTSRCCLACRRMRDSARTARRRGRAR